MSVSLHRATACSSVGLDLGALARAVHDGAPAGLEATDAYSPGRPVELGTVRGPLPSPEGWPSTLRSRNNQLLAQALAPLRAAVRAELERVGPRRVGCVVGTSTSGIREGEAAIRSVVAGAGLPRGFHYAQQELGNPAQFLRAELGLEGPAHVISTACTSSAKALASGARMIAAGVADVVLAGGVDSLCSFTVAGFMALEAVSPVRCAPMSVNRRGITLGEGAALFLLSAREGPVRLAGWGESSDAHHMSAPDPTGRGAIAAIEAALRKAGVAPREVDYVNLHGTGTAHNDAMESLAVATVLGGDVPCSSTKPFTGHTLGAAGALEAAICWATLVDNPAARLPVHLWDGAADPALPRLALVAPGSTAPRLKVALSTSFAFGGSNAALVLVAA